MNSSVMKLYISYKLKMQIFKGKTTKVCWQLFSRFLCVSGATHVRTVMDLLPCPGMSSPTNHISGYLSLRLVISWILSAYTEYCRYDFCAPWTQKKGFESRVRALSWSTRCIRFGNKITKSYSLAYRTWKEFDYLPDACRDTHGSTMKSDFI